MTLKHNHRQGEGGKWTQSLNRLRITHLRSRCISKLNKEYPHDASHLFYTKKEVDEHNNQRLNRLKNQLYEVELVGAYPCNYKPKISSYGTVDDTNLYQVVKIKKGA